MAKSNSRFHVDSLPPFLFFGPSGRKASEPHPFGAKIKFSLLSSGRGKANVIFKFGALKKARLLLNKLMLPKAQFGLLSYRGQDKRDFPFRSSRERDVTIAPCGCVAPN